MSTRYSDYTIERYAAGSVLFGEGDEGNHAYLIESGILEISTWSMGERIVLRLLGPGEIVGEMAIIDDAPRSATATVVTDANLRVIRREQLRQRLKQADPILHMLVRLLTNRHRCSIGALKTRSNSQTLPCSTDSHVTSEQAVEKFRMETELRNAIEDCSLTVHYQPIVDLVNRRIVGFEALARWLHAQKGFISPEQFIPLAEETDLIAAIGEFVVKRSMEDIQFLNRRFGNDGDVFISINVSAAQLADTLFLDMVDAVAQHAGFDPGFVRLEITESQIPDQDGARVWIQAAKAYGFGVSLDDFGTGYSSLSQLLDLNVDTIKIDRSFVQKSVQSERNAAMVRGIVALARAIGMSVIAEGVENVEQQDLLIDVGCGHGQGYLLGRPMSVEKIVISSAPAGC